MINWDMIECLLKRSRPSHTGPFCVAIYSRMPYDDGQETTAEIHIKSMELVLERDPRFRMEGVYSEFGVPFTDLSTMQEYQLIIEKCKAGEVDMVMIHALCRLSKDYPPPHEKHRTAGSLPAGDRHSFLQRPAIGHGF